MTLFTLRDKIRTAGLGSQDFYKFLEKMKSDLREELETDEGYHQLNDRAIMGDPEAVTYFLNQIDRYLRTNTYAGEIPAGYRNLSEALFQEWKGFGPAYRWFTDPRYAESGGLQIIGTKIFIKERGQYVLYDHRFRNLERVQQLIRGLMLNDERVEISESSPEAELKMNDPLWPGRFLRLAIWIHPRVWDDFPTITCRRQIIEYLTLQDQAGTGSIPHEAVPMLRNLALTFRNTVIAGPVDSGKSTFANTIVGEQLAAAGKTLGVIMIEKHPESILPYVFPSHRIVPVRAEDRELMDVGVRALRMDANVIYMTEMRYLEWDFFLWAGAKGFDGIVGTFHTKDPQDIPYLAALSVYTEKRGAIKGYLIEALKACELVLIMEGDRNGKKRLSRVSEIVYDEQNQTVYAVDWMRWNAEKRTWEYHAGVTPEMLRRMEAKNAEAAKTFLKELQRLADRNPMTDPVSESLSSKQVLRES